MNAAPHHGGGAFEARPQMRVDDAVITHMTTEQALDLVGRHVAKPGDRPLALGSANLDHLHHFGPARLSLGEHVAWLLLADGAPFAVRGARLLGEPWPRVTGADLLPRIVAQCARDGSRIAFLGGTREAHEALQKALHRDYPALDVAAFWSPERSELTDPQRAAELVEEIRSAKVDVLVVGLGKPLQELWIDQWGPRTGAAVLLPFGAAGDFMAGTARRAPHVWQRLHLEWLYRLRQEPRRLARRYLVQGPPALLRLRRAELVTSPATDRPGARP